MAVLGNVDVLPAQLWPQGDIRDPLGVWGFRATLTGTGDGGGMKINVRTPAAQGAAYVYTCYSAIIAQTVGTPNIVTLKARLLTNWPNVDAQAGVQAYATARLVTTNGSANFTAPFTVPALDTLITPNDRFILLFDPRPAAGQLTIMELEINENVLAEVWSYEGWGYFWDRSVMQAPGGLRHPGAA